MSAWVLGSSYKAGIYLELVLAGALSQFPFYNICPYLLNGKISLPGKSLGELCTPGSRALGEIGKESRAPDVRRAPPGCRPRVCTTLRVTPPCAVHLSHSSLAVRPACLHPILRDGSKDKGRCQVLPPAPHCITSCSPGSIARSSEQMRFLQSTSLEISCGNSRDN